MLKLNRVFLLGLSLAACLPAQNSPTLENDQVRVLTAIDKPHVKNALHEHKTNRVMIYLDAGKQDIITQDGKKTTLEFKPGDVKWSESNGMHTSEVLSNSPVRIVEVEIKKPADPAKTAASVQDPLKLSPDTYHLEFENSQVRVMRVRFAAHKVVPQHEHILNRVVVYLTEQHSKMTLPDGKTEESQHQSGQFSWGGPAKHIEENVLGTPMEAIVVELKN